MTDTLPSACPNPLAPIDLILSARAIASTLKDLSAANEAAGALVPEVVATLHEHRMFGMWTPKALGGSEMPPMQSLEVVETLAAADPSTAWVMMAGSLATGTAGAYLADEAVAEIFAGPQIPIVAGQGTRPGRAVRDGTGYRLSGDWNFASGMKHAQWIHTLGIVEGTGEPLIFVLPTDQATFTDNWDVMGLRATGSIDYTIDDVHVPATFTHPGSTTTPRRGGALYGVGIIHLAIIGHSAWAIGVSRRMLDELSALVNSRGGRAGALGSNSHFLSLFGEAEAQWHAARSFVYATWAEIEQQLAEEGHPRHASQTRARLALYHATWTAERISNLVYRAAGTSALRSGTLQQLYRDMHAGTQHITSGPGVVEACGRDLVGVSGRASWRNMNLVETESGTGVTH